MANNEYIKQVNSDFHTPFAKGKTIIVPSIRETVIPSDDTFRYQYALSTGVGPAFGITVTTPSGDVIELVDGEYDLGGEFEAIEYGEYIIRYQASITRHDIVLGLYDSSRFNIAFHIVSVLDYSALPKFTIASVIDRVLSLAEPRRKNIQPRYKLDPVQVGEFDKILAPEFFFTQKTLKEILDQIGGFIHGVPRLVKGESGEFDTIHYDILGGTAYAKITEDTPYITHIMSQTIEDYATELDSPIENLVNTLDSSAGAIVDPYAGGFKTVRAEEMYARITDANMVVPTTFPIYSVQKLEARTPSGKVVDITPYVFEATEYGRLSSFNGSYPLSKSYAIYYELGSSNIKGLSFKPESVYGSATENYAITNIIKAAGSVEVKDDYPLLAFRVTYTPIFSARIKQHKPYADPDAWESTLAYNQSANLVETRYYGENLKGAIARMGNPELTRTYRFHENGLNMIPKIGELFKYKGDDYYVSTVTVAVYPESVDFQVGFSKDFNRLSQYVGINSEWRAYEVSERTAYNRDYVYSDYILIGSHGFSNNTTLLTNEWIDLFAQTFKSASSNVPETAMTCAVVTATDKDNNNRTVTLPVVTAAFGNTLCYTFYMQDNYSAGAQSQEAKSSNEKVVGYWQKDVPYVDYYGRFETMSFSLGTKSNEDYADIVGLDLPEGAHLVGGNFPVYVSSDDPLVIDKNGSETLRVSYQLQFVSIDPDLIIGSALSQLMAQSPQKKSYDVKWYIVNKPIGKFDTKINKSDTVGIYGINHTTVGDGLQLTAAMPSWGAKDEGKAWVIARQSDSDENTLDIVLAKNMEIFAGQFIQRLYFSFRHTIPKN